MVVKCEDAHEIREFLMMQAGCLAVHPTTSGIYPFGLSGETVF